MNIKAGFALLRRPLIMPYMATIIYSNATYRNVMFPVKKNKKYLARGFKHPVTRRYEA
jgi:hypothetical protein